jgi:hypothetical protein
MPALTTWVIMLKRRDQPKRHRARLQAKREAPEVGVRIEVTDDDGTKVSAIIVGSPHYDPPLGQYTMEADEL